MAHTYKLAIVVLNQVSSLFPSPSKCLSDHSSSEKLDGVKSMAVSYSDACGAYHLLSRVKLIAPGVSCTKPALGLSWTSCVTTRVMLHRLACKKQIQQFNQSNNDSNQKLSGNTRRSSITKNEEELRGGLRLMWILLSPSQPHNVCRYFVNSAGVQGLDSLGILSSLQPGAAMTQASVSTV